MAGLHDYTVFSGVSINSDASNTVGIALNKHPLSVGSFVLLTSVLTAPNTSALTAGQLGIVQQASGLSLMYISGNTVYTIGASATSAAWS
jgi:hypothetical protein